MKADWHSVKLEGYPPDEGAYMVTIEGAIDNLVEGPALGERVTSLAYYYGNKAWGLLEVMTGRIVAWANRPEEYKGE